MIYYSALKGIHRDLCMSSARTPPRLKGSGIGLCHVHKPTHVRNVRRQPWVKHNLKGSILEECHCNLVRVIGHLVSQHTCTLPLPGIKHHPGTPPPYRCVCVTVPSYYSDR